MRSSKSLLATIGLCALPFATAGSAAPASEIVDRVLAVVNATVITQSDVNAAIRLGLAGAAPGAEPNAVLERLIERTLIVGEVNRYGPPDPSEAEIDDRLRKAGERFASAAEMDAAFAEVGLSRDQLRAVLRDELRIEAYLQQRFAAALQPSDAEIMDYYRGHPRMFMRNGLALTYQEAQADARAALVAERRAALVREWVAGLRRRADITIPSVVRR